MLRARVDVSMELPPPSPAAVAGSWWRAVAGDDGGGGPFAAGGARLLVGDLGASLVGSSDPAEAAAPRADALGKLRATGVPPHLRCAGEKEALCPALRSGFVVLSRPPWIQPRAPFESAYSLRPLLSLPISLGALGPQMAAVDASFALGPPALMDGYAALFPDLTDHFTRLLPLHRSDANGHTRCPHTLLL